MEKNNCHYEEDIYYQNKINDNEIKINDNEKVNQYIKTIIDKININNQIKLYEEFMYSF
jgi:hypothetical protein